MVGRDGIADRFEDIGSRVDHDRFDLLRLDVGLGHKAQHQVHRRMREDAARIGFDRHAGVGDGPCPAETLRHLVNADAPAHDSQKAPRAVQRRRVGGVAPFGQKRGSHPVFTGAAHVQGFGHRAEIAPDARSKAGGDAEPVAQFTPLQPQKPRGGGKGAKGADGARAVLAAQIMLGEHPFGDLAFNLDPRLKGRHQPFAIDAAQHLANGQRGGQGRDGRMGQKPVNMGRIDRDLRIVPVMRVARRSQHPCGHAHRNLDPAAAQKPRIRATTGVAGLVDQDMDGMFLTPRDEKSGGIQNAAMPDADRLGRDGVAAKPLDETGGVFRQRHPVGNLGEFVARHGHGLAPAFDVVCGDGCGQGLSPASDSRSRRPVSQAR